MNRNKEAILVKSILDLVIKNERKERYTGIMYQPKKPDALCGYEDKNKNNESVTEIINK